MFPMWLGCIAFAPMVILYHTNMPTFNDKSYQTMSFYNRVLGKFSMFNNTARRSRNPGRSVCGIVRLIDRTNALGWSWYFSRRWNVRRLLRHFVHCSHFLNLAQQFLYWIPFVLSVCLDAHGFILHRGKGSCYLPYRFRRLSRSASHCHTYGAHDFHLQIIHRHAFLLLPCKP